jgi:hypothetical protein
VAPKIYIIGVSPHRKRFESAAATVAVTYLGSLGRVKTSMTITQGARSSKVIVTVTNTLIAENFVSYININQSL